MKFNHTLPFSSLAVAATMALATLPLTAAPAPTSSQTAVRQTMVGFWGVAQNDFAERSAESSERARTAESAASNPLHPLAPLAPRVAPAPAAALSPNSSVTAHQTVDRETSQGQFGLELLGGIRLFNFTWGEDTVKESDGLQGRW